MKRLVFIGDVHLDRDDESLDDFLGFLDGLRRDCERLVLMGDLFNLWIGDRALEQPHQRAVCERLAGLRGAGVPVRYVEGNRDYRIASGYTGRPDSPLDDASLDGLSETWGGSKLFAIHGDLVNVRDRQYRSWRRLSRSAPVWGLVHLLPRGRRLRFAEGLETKLRRTNLAFKAEFPERQVRDYGARFLRAGHDAVVLGHFHVERELIQESPPGRILVLPEWKGSRRHLEVRSDGAIAFVDS